MAADSDITLFYKDAGVEQYSSLLVEQGFDSLPTLLSMNEAGLQDLKTAVNMKPGHLAALRAKIGREAPAGAPLREAEAQATAPAAPAPEPEKSRQRAGSRDACRRIRAVCLMPQRAQRQSMRARPHSMR